MVKLPQVSGKDLVKFLEKQGFVRVRQKGSHVSLRKQAPDKAYLTVVPLHKNLAIGTLVAILQQCGISRDDFINNFDK